MQLIALTSAAALIATVVASPLAMPAADAQAFNLNSSIIESEPKVQIFNRCPYKVYLWSVLKGTACPVGQGAVLEPGGFYQENFRAAVGDVGTSIKLSKNPVCDPERLLQLEYYPETNKPGYNHNYLDVSYVNAAKTKDCPTCSEGYYLKSGNEDGMFTATSNNEVCPILSCDNWAQCSKMSYVNWDDRQTKACALEADLKFYMCGGQAPGEEAPSVPNTPSAAPSSTVDEKPSSSAEAPEPSSKAANLDVAAAAITPAPARSTPPAFHVKTEVVYVTQVEYVNAKKRHEHGHGHQHVHA